MKKKVMFIFSTIICLILIGCGGGGGSRRSAYTYKWSNGYAALANTRPSTNLKSVVYADGATFLGSEKPPFSSVDDGGRPCGTLLVLTYFNGVEVKSVCTCDPADGEIVDYLSGGHAIPSFNAKRQGIFYVTATYEGHTLDIPVRIYHFGSIHLDHDDLDGDGIADLKNLAAPYGYQIINHSYMSLITSAPKGDYSPDAPLPQFEYGKIYVVKTSSGRYAKLWPTGGAGPNTYNGMDFLSDENGNFAY